METLSITEVTEEIEGTVAVEEEAREPASLPGAMPEEEGEPMEMSQMIEQGPLKVGDLCMVVVESIHEEHENVWAICKTLGEFIPPHTVQIDKHDMCKRNGHMKKPGEHIVIKITGTPGFDHHSGKSTEIYHGQFRNVTPDEMRAFKKYDVCMKNCLRITRLWLRKAGEWPILSLDKRRRWISMIMAEEKSKDKEKDDTQTGGRGEGGAAGGGGASRKGKRKEEEEEGEGEEKDEYCVYPLLRIDNMAAYEKFYHEERGRYPEKWADLLEEKYGSIYGERLVTEVRSIIFLSYHGEGRADVEKMLSIVSSLSYKGEKEKFVEAAKEGNGVVMMERTDVKFPVPCYRFSLTGITHEDISSAWGKFVEAAENLLPKHYDGYFEDLGKAE